MRSELITNRLRVRFAWHFGLLIMLVSAGATGYMLLENWSFFDSLYMTITTLTTVGFGEIHPLHVSGRIFTMFILLGGAGILLYILTDTAELISRSNPGEIFGILRMKEKIDKLKEHYIVCGYGRTGQEVVAQFKQGSVPFVVIELDPELSRRALDDGLLCLRGDATEDEVLQEARVDRAMGIVCTLPDDAHNTFIALSAKGFNENIKIVCRAANPGSESKMFRAGAAKVISPYVIAGRRLATAVTHPLVLEFLDVAMHNAAFDLRLEQITISLQSKLIGITLRDANIKQISGAMVLAVSQQGRFLTNPSPDLTFAGGDILIALGAEEELGKLSELAGP